MSLASFYGGAHKGSVFGESAGYDGFHYGQDVKGHAQGTPIPALAAGRVARAGWQVAHGWWTAVDTGDGWYDTYSHMVALWHDVGTELGQGDAVGPLGTTGLSTGPHLHTQRTRNPFPWAHGTEIDPWPRIASLISGIAGGGISPFDPEEDDMTLPLYFQAIDNNGLDVGVGVHDWWVRPSPGSPLLRMTQGQVADAWTAEGIAHAPFDYPTRVMTRGGDWFRAAFKEDQIVAEYNRRAHPWMQSPVTEFAGLDAAALAGLARQVAVETDKILADDFAAIPGTVADEHADRLQK